MYGEKAGGRGVLGRLSRTQARARDGSVIGANWELELGAPFAELASLPPADRYCQADAAFGEDWNPEE